MITIQHKHSHKVKQVDVREWLGYPAAQVKQWDILQVTRIVKLFYNDRYMGLQEESRAGQLMIDNEFWIVRELDNFDYINLHNRSLVQRIKAMLSAAGMEKRTVAAG